MKILSFATGNLYRFMEKINVVEFIDSLGVNGIEYTYGKTYGERPITKSDSKILLKKMFRYILHLNYGNFLIEMKKMLLN
jgi:hypothetical protein